MTRINEQFDNPFLFNRGQGQPVFNNGLPQIRTQRARYAEDRPNYPDDGVELIDLDSDRNNNVKDHTWGSWL